jgi:hypothetical protein
MSKYHNYWICGRTSFFTYVVPPLLADSMAAPLFSPCWIRGCTSISTFYLFESIAVPLSACWIHGCTSILSLVNPWLHLYSHLVESMDAPLFSPCWIHGCTSILIFAGWVATAMSRLVLQHCSCTVSSAIYSSYTRFLDIDWAVPKKHQLIA